MKKLLSILAAVGLTATASTAVVACTTNIKESKVTVTDKVTDPLLKGTTIATDNSYVATFTTKVRFNKHTNYDIVKDANGSVIGYRLIPYKLHLVRTTPGNLKKNVHPTDLFSFGGPDGKTGTVNAYITTSNTKWFNTDKKRPTAWPTPDNKWVDADGKPHDLAVDGIVRNDITVKATFTIVIAKGDNIKPGDLIKASLIREETDGNAMGIDEANIHIRIPAAETNPSK